MSRTTFKGNGNILCVKNTKEPLTSTFQTLQFRKRCVILHPKRIYEHFIVHDFDKYITVRVLYILR